MAINFVSGNTPKLAERHDRRCVGIYETALMKGPDKQGLLADTGDRFLIDDTGKVAAYAYDLDRVEWLHDRLAGLAAISGVDTAEKFLYWCLNFGNEHNVLGLVNVFGTPSVLRKNGSIDPDTQSISDSMAFEGM